MNLFRIFTTGFEFLNKIENFNYVEHPVLFDKVLFYCSFCQIFCTNRGEKEKTVKKTRKKFSSPRCVILSFPLLVPPSYIHKRVANMLRISTG